MTRRKSTLWIAGAFALLILIALAWKLTAGDEAGEAREAGDEAGRGDPSNPFDTRKQPLPPKLELGGAQKAAISGTIRDPAGNPISDAQVCAAVDSWELEGYGDSRHRCVRSGPDGHYRIEGLWPIRTGVNASAATFKPGRWERREGPNVTRTQIRLRAGETVEGVDVVLEPGGVLVTGVIRDIAGGEIEAAQVVVRSDWFSATRGAAVGFSDEQGKFELWAAPGDLRVHGSAEGYAAGNTEAVAPGEFIELFLTPESVLVGKVVLASSGEPVEGAVVSQGSFFRGDLARTDADGRFRLTELEPGSYKPSARTDALYGQAAEQAHLGLGETSEEIVIRVHPAVLVEGTVLVAGSERPCPDGGVNLDNNSSVDVRLPLDDEGHVKFHGLQPGTYEVLVQCQGYIVDENYPDLVVGEDSLSVVWEVREGLAIRGEVVDEGGAPLANVRLQVGPVVDPEAARAQVTSSHAYSEDDGSFEAAGLLPGDYEISVSSWRGRPGPLEPIPVTLDSGADVNDVRVVMPAVGSVRGRVVDQHGKPVSGATVVAALIEGAYAQSTGRSNDAGEFEVTDLRPGKTRVTAADGGSWWGGGTALRKPGTTDDDIQGEVVEVVGDEVVELVLTVESRDGRITGVVLDEGGGPVADAFIDVERMSDKAGANASAARRSVRWSWNRQPVLTDQDGHFELDELPEGEFIVRANRKGGGEALAEDVALGSHVELVIASTGELAGTVKLAGGGAPERFGLRVEDKANGVRLGDSFFRTDGVWRLSEVPAGKYEISASSGEGNVTLEGELELGEGEVREGIELVLSPRLTLRGRIVDLDTGEPVPGLEVFVSGNGGLGWDPDDGEHRNVTGPDGRFEVDDVPVGRIFVIAWNRAGGQDTKYEGLWHPLELEPEPLVQDVGDLEVVPRRLEPNKKPGDLGYELNQWDPTIDPKDVELTVASIRPGGPADGSGLAPGDVIEKVDGHGVLGHDSSRYSSLTRAPEGSKLKLEIRGGKSVELVLGPPIR